MTPTRRAHAGKARESSSARQDKSNSRPVGRVRPQRCRELHRVHKGVDLSALGADEPGAVRHAFLRGSEKRGQPCRATLIKQAADVARPGSPGPRSSGRQGERECERTSIGKIVYRLLATRWSQTRPQSHTNVTRSSMEYFSSGTDMRKCIGFRQSGHVEGRIGAWLVGWSCMTALPLPYRSAIGLSATDA
jgi:hypothetical protein